MNNQKDHPYIGVDIIIVNDEGMVLLERRAAQMNTYPMYWGLPGGWVEWNETAYDALKREAREELGVEIEVIKFVGKYYDAPGVHPTKTRFGLPHICKIISGTPHANQPEEVSDIGWFDPRAVVNMKLAYDHNQMLIDAGVCKL